MSLMKYKKGNRPWNTGKKRPPFDSEWKDNISKGNRGKKRSEEHKNNIGKAKLGNKNPAFGKPAWNRGLIGYNSKEKSHFWKGGITRINKLVRGCFLYRQWVSDIFERDNYTCVWCGVRSKKGTPIVLNAHHIKSFAMILRENNIKTTEEAEKCQELWNINNGLTLCLHCHKLTDNFAGKSL